MATSLVAGVAAGLRQRMALFGVLAAGLGYVLYRDLDAIPYDDAYFFKRFALNFATHGSFAWNPSEGPVHGLTSQLFQAVSVALLAAREHFVVSAKLFLALCLGLAAWLLAGLARRLAGRFDVAVGVTLLSAGCPLAAWTMQTGMETGLALLVTVLALRAVLQPLPPGRHAFGAAIATTLVYLCRPDAALLPALTYLGDNLRDRRRLVLFTASLAALLGVVLVAFRSYYGTAFPLPFHVKTLGLGAHDAELRSLGAHDKLVHLATFVAFSAPLVFLSRPFAGARAAALVAASVAFVAYHALVTNEIMGYRSRFYVPALIPLALAAAVGTPRALELPRSRRALFLGAWFVGVAVLHALRLLASSSRAPLEHVPWAAFAAQLAIAGWLCFSDERGDDGRGAAFGAFAPFLLGTVASLPPRSSDVPSDRELVEKSSSEVTTTRGLFDVERCLPETITVYHSEIGVPGLVLPRARVVDLAGLMSRSIALEHPSFDSFCTRDRPEVVFLPHRNYAEQNREIAASACIRGYTLMVSRSSSPLYVRNDLASGFERCARDIASFR